MEAITEVYEPQWSGSEALYAQASSIEVLWQDFSHKLGDQVLIPLNTYTAQFPEMRVNSSSLFVNSFLNFYIFNRKKSTSVAANWLITTRNVIPSRIFRPTLPSVRTTLNWQKDARILRKQSAPTRCLTRNCTMNFQRSLTLGYFSWSRTCKLFSPRSKCSTMKRLKFTTNWKRSSINWQRNHNAAHTRWRNLTVSDNALIKWQN